MSTRTNRSNAARARVTVDDYDTRPAADAAIALRRAGLRPALERTFHWGQDTHGLVVAQEPPAGSEVALDSTVLLFVSAPGERGETDADREAVSAQQQSAAFATADVPGAQRSQTPSATTGRRRKPRPSTPLRASAMGSTAAGFARPLSELARPATPPEDSVTPVDTCEDEGPLVDESDGASTWPDDDPLLALAQMRLANASSGAGPGVRLPDPPPLPRPLITLAIAVVTFLVTLVVVLVVGHAHALQAAGAFNGTPISGVQTFVDKLRGNLVWLGGTAMGLVIAVVGIMFMAGHSRAHDLAIRTIVGLAILASISGLVA